MNRNMKSPLPSDWENLIMFNASQTETLEKQLPTGWEIQKGEGIESLVPCFSGFDGGSGYSVTNFWHNALSKGSLSASVSSSPLNVKTSKFTSEKYEDFLRDFSSNIEFDQTKASPAFEPSVGSVEPLIGLKLGKRTYFEDVCGGNNDDGSNFSMNLKPSGTLKKSKSDGLSIQITRCQVEGCNLDLSSAKDYHRKHRVCVSHSKFPKVIVGGLERRFCQQCSRFHGLSEFDDKKRSCRKRLSDHNARRRKSQPDERQHSSLVWNMLSLNKAAEERFAGEGTHSREPTQTEGFSLSFPKAKGIEELLLPSSSSQPPNTTTEYLKASGFLPGKTNIFRFQVPTKGVEDFSVSSGLYETQNFNRALSLLSNTSEEPCEPKHVSLDHGDNNPESSMQPMTEAFPTLFR